MAKAFEDAYSVTLPMIEKYLGCNSDAFSENDFIRLKNVYKSLRDGMAKREDYFEIASPVEPRKVHDPFEEKKKEAGQVDGQQSLDPEGGADETE